MSKSIVYIVTYLLTEVLGTYSLWKMLHSFFDERKVSKPFEVCAFVLRYLIYTSVYLLFDVPVFNIAISTTTMFLLSFMYDSSVRKKLLATILTYAIFACMDILVASLTGYIIFPITERGEFDSVFGAVAINILNFSVSLVASGCKNLKKGSKLPLAYWISLIALPVLTLFMLVLILRSGGLQPLLVIPSVSSALIINFTAFYLFERMSRLYQEKQEKWLIEQQNRYYENQLQLINSSLEATRILRHDMKNHLQAIYSDISSGNIDEGLKHISDISDAYNSGTEIIHTGYPAIDSIVNFKLASAKQSGVRVNASATIPPELNITSFDCTVILGNLLDNAIQASSLVEGERFIDFSMIYNKGMLLIKISNSYANKLVWNGDRLMSSKTESESHGYGLKSVREVVEKYSGTLDFETDEQIFTITAVLYVE